MGVTDRGLDLMAVAKTALSFRKARDWKQFHTPANLAKGLVIEAAELLEHFLWTRGPIDEAEAARSRKSRIEAEIADVAVFLIYLCEDLEIDLAKAIRRKLKANAAKYPVSKARGTATKYDEL
jgi:NTP pyrophosphatase (non-canonical NTP hydrolase)